ncbi:MAG TPA: L-lactate permease, partial [Verrucomicrobiae bacterium]|nr:L-lactate permease [Verrucomicrobiae bacterium]
TAGLAFAIPQFLVSNFIGPSLVDIVSSLCSMMAVAVLLRFWRPRRLWELPGQSGESRNIEQRTSNAEHRMKDGEAPLPYPLPTPSSYGEREETAVLCQTTTVPTNNHSSKEILHAWMPWILLSLFVFVWGLPWMKVTLNGFSAPEFAVAGLHKVVLRVPPVVPLPTPGNPAKAEAAVFVLNWLSATGTGILVAALFAGGLMGFSIGKMFKIYLRTLIRVRYSLITIAAMLALGHVTRYSGLDATLGLALAKTGKLYPFFGTLLGWLGVALTGSDTASNVLFGSLQRITAEQTGVSATLMAAANSSGGVMGKMVDAQSIVVASTATNWYGHEGSILRYVFFHSIALAALMGIFVFLQAYVFPFSRMVVK